MEVCFLQPEDQERSGAEDREGSDDTCSGPPHPQQQMPETDGTPVLLRLAGELNSPAKGAS